MRIVLYKWCAAMVRLMEQNNVMIGIRKAVMVVQLLVRLNPVGRVVENPACVRVFQAVFAVTRCVMPARIVMVQR